MVEPRVARAGRRRRTGRGHMAGAKPVHAGPRGHPCGAPRGRRVGIWRAHGLVGPGKIVGAVTRKRYTAPLFNLKFFQTFFRVGQCPTHLLPFVGDVGARQASNMVCNNRMASIAWTGVHAIEITIRAEMLT